MSAPGQQGGTSSSSRLPTRMSPQGFLQVIFWLGAAGMLMTFTAIALWQPLRSDPFQQGAAWRSWDWWLRPMERNAFLRAPVAGDGFTTLHVSKDGKHLWAAGGGGRIVHSQDDGATWDAVASGTTNGLNEINFFDTQHGWAAGAGNTLLRTTNGGVTWTRGDDSAVRVVEPEIKQEPKSAPQKTADASPPARRAVAALGNLPPNFMGQARPQTQRRTDQNTAPNQPSPSNLGAVQPVPVLPAGPIDYTHVAFPKANVGVAVGAMAPTNLVSTIATNRIPVVAVTTNGGSTWFSRPESAEIRNSAAPLWLSPAGWDWENTNSLTIVAVLPYGIFYEYINATETGGMEITSEIETGNFSPEVSPLHRVAKIGTNGKDVWFLPYTNTGFTNSQAASGAESFQSKTNRFNSRHHIATSPFAAANDFAIPNNTNLVFVGANGCIAITSTDGAESKLLKVSPPVSLRAVAFFGANGWTVGGHHFFTTDDTVTWRTSSLPPRRSPAPWYYAAVLLLTFAHVGLLRATRPKPLVFESIAPRGTSDNPVIHPLQDALRFGPMIEGISRFFRNPATVPPLTVAINGGWGMGKSSIMRLLQTDLKKHGVPTVWFNAWHHQNEESLFPPLLKHVTSQAVPGWWQFGGLRPVGWLFRARLLGRRVRVPKLPTLAVLAVLLGAAWWLGRGDAAGEGWSWKHFGGRAGSLIQPAQRVAQNFSQNTTTMQLVLPGAGRTNGPEVFDLDSVLQTALTGGLQVVLVQTNAVAAANHGADKAASGNPLLDLLFNFVGLSSLLLLLRALFGHLKAFGVDPARLLHEAGDRLKPRDLEAKASFQIQFAEQFRDVTGAMGNDQLVIFVDDLDRCSPDKVMQALEAVNFLVTSGKCFVVLGLAREQVESAMAQALGAVAELVTYDAEELAQVRRATPAPVTDGAKEKENHRLKAIAYARRYLLKLVNIELEVPRATPEAGRDMVKGGAKPAVKKDFWRPANLAAMAAAVLLCAGGLALLVPKIGGDGRPGAIPAQAAGTNVTSTLANAGPTNAPPPVASTNVMAWTGPSREGAKSEPVAARRQWLWPGVFAVLLLLAAVAVLRRRREREAKDAPDFLKALDVHWAVIETLFPTPREKKRFINRVRYLAMRRDRSASAAERTSWELLRAWFRSAGKGEEKNLAEQQREEATAAAHTIFLMLEKALGAAGQAQGSQKEESALRLELAHIAAFKSNPPPDQRREFERLSEEIRTF